MQNGLQKAIDHFSVNGRGGQVRLAKALGVEPMAISQWKRRGTMPPERCVEIEVATGGAVTRLELRPDIFGELKIKKAI